jgi:hypothetical protein
MIQLPFYRVKQRDLETYLARVYRTNGFDFGRAAGTVPGMCPEYRVQATLPAAWTARDAADRIRRGHRTNNVGLILNVLCVDGYIPAGHYTVDTHPEPPPAQVYRDMLMRTGDPSHPDCASFRQRHCHDRTFSDPFA